MGVVEASVLRSSERRCYWILIPLESTGALNSDRSLAEQLRTHSKFQGEPPKSVIL